MLEMNRSWRYHLAFMTYQPSPTNNTSAELEKTAIVRFRSLISCIPSECKIFREIWGNSTVLCLDFAECPEVVDKVMEQSFLILLGANYLGLANSLSFKLGHKVKGWMTMVDR